MNGDALGTRKQGGWLQTWLGGTLVALGLTLTGIFIWMSLLSYYHPTAGSDSITITLYSAPYLAIATGVLTFLLIGMAMLAERRAPKPLSLWLLLGLVANTPFALFVWAVQHLGDCFENCRQFSELDTIPPVLAVYGFGLAGATAAFRIRHRSWH